jgi:hypothetical protein
MKKALISLMFLVFLSSCGDKEKEDRQRRAKQSSEKEAQIEQQNTEAVKQLIDKIRPGLTGIQAIGILIFCRKECLTVPAWLHFQVP